MSVSVEFQANTDKSFQKRNFESQSGDNTERENYIKKIQNKTQHLRVSLLFHSQIFADEPVVVYAFLSARQRNPVTAANLTLK